MLRRRLPGDGRPRLLDRLVGLGCRPAASELGPVPQHELKAARDWADAILPAGRDGTGQARSA
jgi:hypothetical protein